MPEPGIEPGWLCGEAGVLTNTPPDPLNVVLSFHASWKLNLTVGVQNIITYLMVGVQILSKSCTNSLFFSYLNLSVSYCSPSKASHPNSSLQ